MTRPAQLPSPPVTAPFCPRQTRAWRIPHLLLPLPHGCLPAFALSSRVEPQWLAHGSPSNSGTGTGMGNVILGSRDQRRHSEVVAVLHTGAPADNGEIAQYKGPSQANRIESFTRRGSKMNAAKAGPSHVPWMDTRALSKPSPWNPVSSNSSIHRPSDEPITYHPQGSPVFVVHDERASTIDQKLLGRDSHRPTC